jgi:mannose-6-phosphate isomerase-like protein (cupin superfamily)
MLEEPMYQKIWSDYLSRQKEPLRRTIYLGKAFRLIRDEMRRSRNSVAEGAKIGTPLLRHMELEAEVHSTWDKIERLSASLGIPIEQLLARGREEFPYNFFIQTEDKRPHFSDEGMTAFPYSPPVASQNDFSLLKIELRAGKKLSPCLHPGAQEIACYVLDGPLAFRFGEETYLFKGNQSFFFDGAVEHGFKNENPEKTVKFFLALNPPPSTVDQKNKIPPKKKGLDLAYAIEYVRRKASPIPAIPLPWSMMAGMSGLSLRELMHLESGEVEIILWDKLEAIACGTGISLDEIVDVARGKIKGRMEICTALTRGELHYEDQFGIRIYSAVRPGAGRRKFFIGQVYLQKRAELRSMRRRWRYQTNAKMCAVMQDGRILIEYGNRKKETLTTGGSIYFDANLEFVIHNLERQESKFLLFTHPPLF